MNTNIKSEKPGLVEKVINFFKSSDDQTKFSKDMNELHRIYHNNPSQFDRLIGAAERYGIDPTGMSTEELKAKIKETQRKWKTEHPWYKDDFDSDLE